MSLCINDWVGPRRNAGLHPRAKPASVTLYPGQNGEKQKVHFVILAPVRHPSAVLNICVTDIHGTSVGTHNAITVLSMRVAH